MQAANLIAMANDKDLFKKALELHKKLKGKLSIASKIKLGSAEALSLAYSPGVAAVSRAIAENKEEAYNYTIKSSTVAVISNGTAVLGLGNIGAEAALPVMEGKAILFKEFAGIDAFPLCVNITKPEEMVSFVKAVAPNFAAVNLEDIKAPECFEIENSLQDIGMPVMHDDQHGTAVVVLAGLLNSAKLVNKNRLKIAVSGAGAAGIAIIKLLQSYEKATKKLSFDIIALDSKGIISSNRADLNSYKEEIAATTNKSGLTGGLEDAVAGSDVFIGVSKAGILTKAMVKTMSKRPIIFALANPVPEIMPDEAKEAGAYIVATGRSDFSNQVNNVLAFPGIFKGAISIRAKRITNAMKIAAAEAIAGIIDPEPEKIIPSAFEKGLADAVAKAVAEAAQDSANS